MNEREYRRRRDHLRRQEAYAAALQRERQSCERRGKDDRVEAIDAELERAGKAVEAARMAVDDGDD